MKRFRLLLLTVLMSMVGMSVSAHDFELDGIYYSFVSGPWFEYVRVTFQGDAPDSYSNEYSGEVVIPPTVTYNDRQYYVVAIINNTFFDCSGLTSVTIGKYVNSIPTGLFNGCTNLTSLQVVPENTTFDSRDNCNAIIETASNTLIAGCQNTDIPNTVTSIGDSAFYRCSGLTSISIPNSVTSIGNTAFSGCSGLTSVDILNSVTSIGISAFSGCSGLTSVDIPNSVTSIGNGAFYGCSGLTSVDIPNSVTTIGSSAFQNCSGLASIDIPNSVTSIGSSAFQGCSSLTSIYIPNTVTSIDKRAFSNCSGLTSVIVMWETPIDIIYIDNWYNDPVFYGINCGQVTLYVPYGCKDAYLAAGGWNQFNIEELTSQQIINATGISLDCSSLTFDGTGQTATLAATITPVDATFKTVVWSSNNTDVATVDDNGVVTAIGNGTAVITAKTIDGTSLTAQCNVTVNLQTVTITMATNSGSAREAIGYSSEYGLDFTNVTDVKAYVATGFTDDGDVLLSRIYIVPANTGVYLKSVAGAGITVTVPTTDRYVLYANLLKPYILTGTLATSETIDGVTYKNYVVGTKDGKPSFAIWGGGTFGPHKAYMPIPESLVPAAARAGGFSVKYIDEEPTAIEETIGYSTPASDILYDLQGRKVSNAKRGIYVRNGKKIFIK